MKTTACKIKVHFMPGDGKGWALDEDRRQMRQALTNIVEETGLASAEVIHTPFWQGLSAVAPELLKKTFVIAHADNPPFFYLKQPEFLLGQQQVDLWIARSQEALEQFKALKLPVEYIPYTIDPKLFFPITDKQLIRKKFSIPEDAYVIANFHRDTEGADLKTPKLQKAPELMLAILKKLKNQRIPFHVLLAGPRRHWLRNELVREGLPFTFVGKIGVEGDDFGVNILDRSILNELTNAADLLLIPSRWEGGPQSVMEAAACRCKILSTPLGVARDILEPASLYHSVAEAAKAIEDDIKNCSLEKTIQPQWERWHQSHTTASMATELQKLYERLSARENFQQKVSAKKLSWIQAQQKQLSHTFQRRVLPARRPRSIGWNHQVGHDHDLDEILLGVGSALQQLGIVIREATGHGIELIGWPISPLPKARENCHRIQWVTPSLPLDLLLREAFIIAPAVQDIVNLRRHQFLNPALVLPFPLAKSKEHHAESSQEPLLISENDFSASMNIWRAMALGRPIVYPSTSAYYEQVFHGGLCYHGIAELSVVMQEALENKQDFNNLAKLPTREQAQKALSQLLSLFS